MTYSTEKYKNFCNTHFERINTSYDCVCSNKCSEISEFISSLLIKLREMESLPWDDEVNSAFKNNINSCYNTLEKVKNSIDSDFSRSEILYTEAQSLMDELKNAITSFDLVIDDKPIKDNYAQKWYHNLDFMGWIFPNYERDYDEWIENCNKKQQKCDDLYDQITSIITELESINSNKLETPKIELMDIPGATIKIVVNENYHYCMTDKPYRDMTLYDPGNRGGEFGKGGCSMTAAATAISLATNSVINPKMMNDFAKKNKVVGRNHRTEMITQLARLHDLDYNIVYKKEAGRINDMIERVKNKESTVVMLLPKNKDKIFHSYNGHYLNIVDAKEENGEVFVKIWETAYKDERNKREGWHELDKIVDLVYKEGFIEISPNKIEGAYQIFG